MLLLFLVHNLIFAMLLSVGLRLPIENIEAAAHRRGLITRTVLVTNVVVPLIAMVLVAILPLTPLARGIILLFAICPGAPFLIGKFKEQTHLSAVLLAIVSLCAVVTLPIWASIVQRLFALQFQIHAVEVLLIVLRKLLVPLLIGVAIRQFTPRFAEPVARVAAWFYKIALAVALVIILVKAGPQLLHVKLSSFLAVILVTVVSALVGHVAGGPDLQDRGVIATFAALGNPALVATIISHSYPNLPAGVLVAGYVIVRGLTILPYPLWVRRRLQPPAQQHPLPPTTRPAHAA